MHDGARLFPLDEVKQQLVIRADCNALKTNGLAANLLPRSDPHPDSADWRKRLSLQLDIDLAAREIVNDYNVVANIRQMESRRPPAKSVSTQHDDRFHGYLPCHDRRMFHALGHQTI